MTVMLLTEHHLKYLSLNVGCTGLSESKLVKMPQCWKSHVVAQIISTGALFEYYVKIYSIIGQLRPQNKRV